MIDEQRTLEIYGYNSHDWAMGSHKQIVVVCDECGVIRTTPIRDYSDLCRYCSYKLPSRNKKIGDGNRGKHVSEETRYKLRENHSDVSGKNNPMFGKVGVLHPKFCKHPSPQTLLKMSLGQLGKSHSKETRQAMSASRTGSKNCNWKGGTTEWVRLLRSTRAYKNWRTSVYERDEYTCQSCSSQTSGNLQAHHIHPVRDHKNTLLIFDINNGITLCKECHDITKGREYDHVVRFVAILEDK